MCGIFGWITSKPYTEEEWQRMSGCIERLFIASERRGNDATGYAYVTGNTVKVVKQAGPAEKFLQTLYKSKLAELTTDRPFVFIGHTRAGTKGSPTKNANNHPILSTKLALAMAHNGIIQNDVEAREKYHLKCDGEVDSESILRLAERGIEGGKLKHLSNGIVEAYKKLNGSAATAWVWGKHPNALVLAADSNPIVLGLVESLHTIFFASTEEILMDGLNEATWKYGFFKQRSHDMDALIRKVADESLLILTTDGAGEFRIHERKCELKTVSYYAGGISWDRDRGQGSWKSSSSSSTTPVCGASDDECGDTISDQDMADAAAAEAAMIKEVEAEERKQSISVDEFVAKQKAKQGFGTGFCQRTDCPIIVRHQAHVGKIVSGGAMLGI